jgi:CHAD domain-containing protein
MARKSELELKLAFAPEGADVLGKRELAEAPARGRLEKPAKAERIDLDAEMNVAEGFTSIVFSCLRHFRLNEDILRKGRSPEALHQLHVATRRLHTALLLFKSVVRGKRYRKLMKRLRWLSSLLGNVRDYDVAIDLMDDSSRSAELRQAREAAYDGVLKILGSSRLPQLIVVMVRWLLVGKWRERSSAVVPLPSFLTLELDKSWAEVSNEGKHLLEMGEKKRHRFRLHVKQLRYALEFSRGLHRGVKEQRKPFRRALRGLQERLGLLNDRRIAREFAQKSSWVATPTDQQIRWELLRKAHLDFKDLAKVGPYWRETHG